MENGRTETGRTESRTDGWTDGRTDGDPEGDPDGHHHTIIRPVRSRAYKNDLERSLKNRVKMNLTNFDPVT